MGNIGYCFPMKIKNNILITGATGLLGGELTNLLHESHQVIALVRKKPNIVLPNVQYIEIDLNNNWDIDQLPKNVNTIFHLAQSEKFRNFPRDAVDVFNVNVQSTAKLLEYAESIGVKRFIYASSGGIYASSRTAFQENSPLQSHGSLGYYLGTKICSEILVQNYSNIMKAFILRFFFIYGKGQKRSMLMPRLVDKIKANEPITLQGQNGLRINPIHVKDAAHAVIATLGCKIGHTFNVAGNESYDLRQIANIIGGLLDIGPIFETDNGSPSDIVADIRAMRSHLHEPKIILKKGIEELL